jgi:choline transporter-like protein 2/4/5
LILLPILTFRLPAACLLQIFFSVYEMAIDTVLLSFCEDAESHSGHPRFAPPLLLEAIGEKEPDQAADPYSSGGGARKGRR